MTDTTKVKDEPTTGDPDQPGDGGGDGTNGQHEGNGTGGGTTFSPMGQHEGNTPAK